MARLPLCTPQELLEELAALEAARHPRGPVVDQARFRERQLVVDGWVRDLAGQLGVLPDARKETL